jgi:hypothetical protein
MKKFEQIENAYKKYCRSECKDKRNDAKLRLTGYSRRVLIKIDELHGDSRMVDFFVFIDDSNLIIVILEIKGKNFSDTEVKSKFLYGSPKCEEIIENFLKKCTISGFYPIFLVPSVNSRFEWDRLKEFCIMFYKKPYGLILETGVIELSEVIKRWG